MMIMMMMRFLFELEAKGGIREDLDRQQLEKVCFFFVEVACAKAEHRSIDCSKVIRRQLEPIHQDVEGPRLRVRRLGKNEEEQERRRKDRTAFG